MAKEKFVSSKIARERLEKAGLGETNVMIFLEVGTKAREHDLEVVEMAAKKLGPQVASRLIDNLGRSSAFQQTGKRHFSKLGQIARPIHSRIISVLEAFTPHLAKIVKSPALRKNGYSIIIMGAKEFFP